MLLLLSNLSLDLLNGPKHLELMGRNQKTIHSSKLDKLKALKDLMEPTERKLYWKIEIRISQMPRVLKSVMDLSLFREVARKYYEFISFPLFFFFIDNTSYTAYASYASHLPMFITTFRHF